MDDNEGLYQFIEYQKNKDLLLSLVGGKIDLRNLLATVATMQAEYWISINFTPEEVKDNFQGLLYRYKELWESMNETKTDE